MNYKKPKPQKAIKDTGRPPKPTALKILEGNPGCRPLNENEPKPEIGMPEKPEWLKDDRALKLWEDLSGFLLPLGLLTKIDGIMFGMLCQSAVLYGEYTESLVSSAGYDVDELRKISAIANEHFKNMRVLSSLFGLSPSDRSRLHVTNTQKNEDDDILD